MKIRIFCFLFAYMHFFLYLCREIRLDTNVRIISEDNYCQLYGYILFFELNEVAALLGNSKKS